jgi:glycerophosphoryl diester phosphodiesterase
MLKIAHRGSAHQAPENSLLSFEHAISEGADAIELDVRRCKTGEVVVLHDASLKRMTGSSMRVSAHSLQAIQEHAFLGYSDHFIPTLERVFEQFGQQIMFNVEIKESSMKCGPIVAAVIELIDKFNLSETAWVSSFNPFVIRAAANLAPHIRLGFLYDKVRYTPTMLTEYYNVSAWHPHHSLITEAYVEVAQKRQKEIYAWTVNEVSEIERLKSLGISGIISDNLSLFN